MCLNSKLKQSEQIERFVENGMPQKIVKTVKYTLKKRAEEINRNGSRIASLTSSPSMSADSSNEKVEELLTKLTNTNTTKEPTTNLTNNNQECPIVTPTNTNTTTTITRRPLTIMSCPVTQMKTSNVAQIPAMCGRLRKLQQKDNPIMDLGGGGGGDGGSDDHDLDLDGSKKQNAYVDILSVGTQLTKQFAESFSHSMGKLQKTKIYTLLTRTTQPAHIIAVCILSFVLVIVGPDLLSNNATMDKNKSASFEGNTSAEKTAPLMADGRTSSSANGNNENNTFAIIAYLGAFATHFGAQIWMTFVSGLSLYFSLPRHTFGQCQQILFPKYFALNAILSIGMLIIYVKYFCNNWKNISDWIQIVSLAVTALIEVTVRLYLAPPMLRLMHEKYRIEDTVGSGQEVGSIVQGDLVQCPHYQRIHKTFRRIHMTIAMGNMTVLMATCLHLYFLATKIHIA